MYILIVGAGVVGYNLSRQLVAENHNVVLVDPRAARLEEIAQKVDCRTLAGDGASPAVLRDAGISRADMLIAVSDNDTVNLTICMLGQHHGVPQKIARLRNRDYHDHFAKLDPAKFPAVVDHIINPEQIIVTALEQFIGSPGATEVAEFMNGQVQMRKFKVPPTSPLAGKKLKQLAQYMATEPFLVVAVARGDETIVPNGETQILPGDEVVLVMLEGVLPFVLPLLGAALVDVNKVVISGTTQTALELARRLEKTVAQVHLIEEDTARANEVADLVTRSGVFHGNATDPEYLREIGVDAADFYVALEDRDERNAFSALLAKKAGAKRVAALANQVEYLTILRSIGIDVPINVRVLTVSAILRFIRRGRIMSVAKFHGDAGEAIELTVDAGARILGKPLKDIGIAKTSMIVGAVQRGQDIFLPNGNTVIHPADRVVVFTNSGSVGRVEKMFAQRTLLG